MDRSTALSLACIIKISAGSMIGLGGRFRRSEFLVTVTKPLQHSNESMDEQAGDGAYHTYTSRMRDDADHALVGAVRACAVRERNDGKCEQPSKDAADR